MIGVLEGQSFGKLNANFLQYFNEKEIGFFRVGTKFHTIGSIEQLNIIQKTFDTTLLKKLKACTIYNKCPVKKEHFKFLP